MKLKLATTLLCIAIFTQGCVLKNAGETEAEGKKWKKTYSRLQTS
jgi:hypothetical protein